MPHILVSHASADDAAIDTLSGWLSDRGHSDHFVDHLHIDAGSSWDAALRREARAGRERRRNVRVPVEVPIIYTSDTLTFEANARDLSVGGMFVATELLDELGTRCQITVLPDGARALTMVGVVCHVVASETGEAGCPPGVGIKFESMGLDAKTWLHYRLGMQPST